MSARAVSLVIAAVVSVTLAAYFILAGASDFYRALPGVYHRGIRVRYVDDAQEWRGLREAIDALWVEEYEGQALLSRVVIEVYPPGRPINGLEANGTVVTDSAPLGRDYFFLQVRQLLDEGKVASACASAIHHEFVEHVIPKELDGNPNLGHALPEQTALSLRMTRKCEALLSQQP